MFGRKINKTDAFKDAVMDIYSMVDVDDSGYIDRQELTIAICQLYFKLNQRFPGMTSLPSKQMIDHKLKECDLDGSGRLSLEEFTVFAQKWFDEHSSGFLVSIVVASVVTMVLLPNGAGYLWDSARFLKRIPKPVFKIAIGMGFRTAANKVRDKMDEHRNAKTKKQDAALKKSA